jgi:hypothetical protein
MEAGVPHVEQGGLSLSLVLYNSPVVGGITHVGSALRCSHPRSEMASVEFQVFLQIVTENFTRFCGFRSSPTTSQHWLKVLTQT